MIKTWFVYTSNSTQVPRYPIFTGQVAVSSINCQLIHDLLYKKIILTLYAAGCCCDLISHLRVHFWNQILEPIINGVINFSPNFDPSLPVTIKTPKLGM